MAAQPSRLLRGAQATAHLPCPRDITILPRPGLQPDEASSPSSVPFWVRLLPQEPGALLPERARPPEPFGMRLELIKPRLALGSQAHFEQFSHPP
jgi:hypothetical protein